MSTLALDIPDDVRVALKLPAEEAERELRIELALALYQRRVLPIGKARALARMTRWQFEDLLGQRRVVRHYSAEGLREDIAHAGDRPQFLFPHHSLPFLNPLEAFSSGRSHLGGTHVRRTR